MKEKMVVGYKIKVEEVLEPNALFGRRNFTVTMRAEREFDGAGGWIQYYLVGQKAERRAGSIHTFPISVEKEMKKWAASILRDREGRATGLSPKGQRDDRKHRSRARQEDSFSAREKEARADGYDVA